METNLIVSVGISRLHVIAPTLMRDGDHFCRVASGPSTSHDIKPKPFFAFRADAQFASLCKNGTQDEICRRPVPTYRHR